MPAHRGAGVEELRGHDADGGVRADRLDDGGQLVGGEVAGALRIVQVEAAQPVRAVPPGSLGRCAPQPRSSGDGLSGLLQDACGIDDPVSGGNYPFF